MLVSSKVSNKRFYNVEFEEKVVSVNRVVKVTKGGRIFSFSALVVIGNKNNYFGIGLGKSLEVNEARRKAINNAKKNLYYITLTKSKSITHTVDGKYCASRVIMRPGKVGGGIIAGGPVRVILESLGAKDVVAKCIGSTNPYNITMSTLDALLKLKSHKYYMSINKTDDTSSGSESDDVDTIDSNSDE
jgi:small subunit ribosomal protein S5